MGNVEDSNTPYQERGQRLFQVLFGPGWKRVLRSTACFNVCLFRTRSAQDLVAMVSGT